MQSVIVVQNFVNVDVGRNAIQTVLAKSLVYPALLDVAVLVSKTFRFNFKVRNIECEMIIS